MALPGVWEYQGAILDIMSENSTSEDPNNFLRICGCDLNTKPTVKMELQ
jgi:hypothetical protein